MTGETANPPRPRLGSALVLLLLPFVFAAMAKGVESGAAGPPMSMEEAADLEKSAYSALYSGLSAWSVENTRELARIINQLPEPVASRALWLGVTAMPSFDSTQIIASSLSSPSSAIRIQGADILTGLHSPDTLRMLLTRLFQSERDSDVLLHAVDGMAAKSFPESVRNLMEVMNITSSAESPVVEAAAAHLKRLTRANLPSNAIAWRDWWMSHSRDYQ